MHVRAWIGYGLGARGRRIGLGACDGAGGVHVVVLEQRAVALDHGVRHGGTSDVRFAAEANTSATPRSGIADHREHDLHGEPGRRSCAFTITGSATSPTSRRTVRAANRSGSPARSRVHGPTPSATRAGSPSTPALRRASGHRYLLGRCQPARHEPSGHYPDRQCDLHRPSIRSACAYSLNEYGHVFRAAAATRPCSDANGHGVHARDGNRPAKLHHPGPLAGPDLNIFSLPYSVAPFTPLRREFGTAP